MARVALSQLPDWNVVDEGQDLRGLRLQDETGATIGLIDDLIVDTDAGEVAALVLDTGEEVSTNAVEIGPDVVVLRTGRGPRAAAPATTFERVEGLRVPVVEESLRVGKRQVEGGGVRVTTEVEDVPVREPVTVRQEAIDVRRMAVRRTIQDGHPQPFQEHTFVVRARAEAIDVRKQLYVVEEIYINKRVVERTETIDESVRRMRVDIEQLPDQPQAPGSRHADSL